MNDVALVDDKVLATCSNDATVRLWRAGSAGQCTFNLVQHTDCVMALAAAPQQGLLASAGLSSEVFVWDLPTGTQLSTVRHAAHVLRIICGVGCVDCSCIRSVMVSRNQPCRAVWTALLSCR